MAARAALKQGRVCSLFSRAGAPQSFSFRRRISTKLRETETDVDKALRKGDASFVKHTLLENNFMQVSSTVKESDHNDKPIFFATSVDDRRYIRFTALSLEDDGNLLPKYGIYPPHPYSSSSSYGYCSSTCFGVLCFREGLNILLWNPTTNESKLLPRSDEFDHEKEYSPGVTKHLGFVTCELCADNKSQDYKVVRFNDWRSEGDGWHAKPRDPIEFAVYSLKTDSWKTTVPCPELLICGDSKALIDGVCYMKSEHRETGKSVILTFDFSTETISYIPLPFSEFRHYTILDYHGLLSIISSKYVRTDESFHEHWVMRNGSWCKLSLFHTCKYLYPLCFSRNCELLFFKTCDDPHRLLVFDYATGNLKHLDHYGYQIIRLIPFSKGSVKLNRAMEIEEHEKEEDGRTIEGSSQSCTF